MRRFAFLILSIFSVCTLASDQSSDRNVQIVYMGEVFTTRDQLHKIYLDRPDLAADSMRKELRRDIRYLHNLAGDESNDDSVRRHATTLLIDLAAFREVFEIGDWAGDTKEGEILDEVRKEYPERYEKKLCEDWSSPTGRGKPQC